MVPADHFETTFFRDELGFAHIIGGNGETVARGIVATIDELVEGADSTEIFGIHAQEGTAAFVRVGFRAVGADFAEEVFGYSD